MKKRAGISLVIAFASGLLCWLIHLGPDPNDFRWTLGAAHDLLLGHDPYLRDYSVNGAPYPLPAAAFALPFLWAGPQLAGALFFGASSGLLAFGLARHGYARLLIFLAFPYWMAMLCVQWSPLVMAAALFPWLVPVTLAKPQIGIPILLTKSKLHWNGIVACVALVLGSLLVMPAWPLRWLSQLGGWPSYVPLFALPLGPALLLALSRLSDPDGHLLLLTSLTPQHWFYDSFILWLIPRDRREILASCFLSWGAGVWRIYHLPRSRAEFGSAAAAWIYLPMLGVLLCRRPLLAERGKQLLGQ